MGRALSRMYNRITGYDPKRPRFTIIKFYDPEDKNMDNVHAKFWDFSESYTDIVFMEADIMHNEDAADELSIKHFPAFIAFNKSTEFARYEGKNMDIVHTLLELMMDEVHAKDEET